ncbi:FUSC family protein [Terrisporobacter sp.]
MKKIGMRNIKTDIAVFLATLSGYLKIVETPVYTVSVCIFSIKNTIKNSLDDAFSRITGTLLGGFIGYLCSRFFMTNIIFVTLGVIFIIYLCNELKINYSSAIASVTFISICLGVGNNHPFAYSLMRTIDSLVGVIIALVVNFDISRHKYIEHLWNFFNLAYDDYIDIINSMIKTMDFSLSYKKLNKKFDSLQEYYNHLVDELSLSSKSYSLNTLYNRFNLCENLIHHVHDLYLIEKKASYLDKTSNEDIYKYHKNNILKLLSEGKK